MSADNTAQIEYWNAGAGDTWATFQDQLDRQLAPLGLAAMQALGARPGEHVLDLGCGCGQTTLELAQQVGATGMVHGVDISRPMLSVARRRPIPQGAAQPQFLELDAQTGALGARGYDAAFSRFGVMFFADLLAAFSNVLHALKPGGRLAFVCWRNLAENVWMRAPLAAALPFLPPLPPPEPLAPGPFAFADASRIRDILQGAGFGGVTITPFDTRIGGLTQEQALTLALRSGPLGAALREHPDRTEKVSHAVRDLLAGYGTPQGVLMPAATWIVTAQSLEVPVPWA